MEINIAICDDNEAFIRQLASLIKAYAQGDDNSYRLHSFTSGKTLLGQVRKSYTPDLVFLDIDLNEDLLGTTVGIGIKKANPNALLAYVSDYSCYYRELAHAEPFCFLDKPIDAGDLRHVLNGAARRLHAIKPEFIFTYKANGSLCRTDLKEVMYFESRHRVINIHMRSGEVVSFYEKLDDLEKKIEEIYPYFARVSKSYYVNCYDIRKFSSTCAIADGLELKISPNYRKRFMEKMRQML